MIVPQIVGFGATPGGGLAPGTTTGESRIEQATELLCRQLATGANLFDALQRVTAAFKPILTAQEQQAIIEPAKQCAAARTAPSDFVFTAQLKPGVTIPAPTTTTTAPTPTPTPTPTVTPAPTTTTALTPAQIDEQKRKERIKKIAIGAGIGVVGLGVLIAIFR
jgi:hypothetical protein